MLECRAITNICTLLYSTKPVHCVWCLGMSWEHLYTRTPGQQTQLVINTWPTLPARPGQASGHPSFLPSLTRPVKAPQWPPVLSSPLPLLRSLHNGLWNNNAMFSRKLICIKNVLPDKFTQYNYLSRKISQRNNVS